MTDDLPNRIFYNGRSEIDLANLDSIDDFKSPMAARQLIGVLRYINDFSQRPMNTLHVMTDPERELAHLFFNCHKASVLDVLSKPVPSGYFEVSASQNLFDNLGVPDEIEVDVQDLM